MEDCEEFCTGSHRSVWFANQATKQLGKLNFDANDIRRAHNILERIANGEETVLPPQHWKQEGRYSSGKPKIPKIAVYAVKAFNLRIYGGFIGSGSQAKFLCVEVAKKKNDKADRDQLERVAKRLGEYHERTD